MLLAAGTNVNQELDELVTLIPYRAGVLAEALAQRDNILNYFRGLLTFTRSSHPATFYLCMAAVRVGPSRATTSRGSSIGRARRSSRPQWYRRLRPRRMHVSQRALNPVAFAGAVT